MAFLGLAALLLAVAGIAAAATYEDDDTTPAAIDQPATTTTSVDAGTTTTLAATTTTTAPATTTTAGAPTTTSTTRPSTTTTRRGATTTTSTPAGPAAACTTAQMDAAVTTDKPSYGPSDPVKFHSTLHNHSAAVCTYPSFVFTATVRSPGGTTVTGFERVNESPGSLGPGQGNDAFVTWDRLGCAPAPCTQTTPGTYSVSVTWNFPGGPYTATKSFDLS